MPGSDAPPDASTAGIADASIFTEDASEAMAALAFVETELLVHTLPGAGEDEIAAAFEEARVAPRRAAPGTAPRP